MKGRVKEEEVSVHVQLHNDKERKDRVHQIIVTLFIIEIESCSRQSPH